MWDIYGTRITKPEWERWKRKHLMRLLKGKQKGPYIARGHRGNRGRKGRKGSKGSPGPPGPPGPPIMIPDRRGDPLEGQGRDQM